MSKLHFRNAFYLLLVVVLLTGCVAPPMEAPPASSDAESGAAVTLPDDVVAWGDQVRAACGDATVNVAVSTHPSVEAFRAMAPAFTQATGINVTFDELSEAQARDKQFLEATGETGLYDVLMMDSFWVAEYVAKDVAMPLDDFINNPELTPEWFDWEDILPAFRSGLGMFDGTTYGVPFAGETRFLAYRQDLFDKYEKEVPKTLDEMLELARFFNGKEDGLYGIGHRAQTGIRQCIAQRGRQSAQGSHNPRIMVPAKREWRFRRGVAGRLHGSSIVNGPGASYWRPVPKTVAAIDCLATANRGRIYGR